MTERTPSDRRPRLLILMISGFALLSIVGAAFVMGNHFFFSQAKISNPPYSAQTACDHPYLPLRDGAVWRYRGDIQVDENEPVPTVVTWRVETISGDLASAVAVVIVEYDYEDGAYLVLETVEYTCSPEGLRRTNSIVATGTHSINQYVMQDGFYLPAHEKLERKGSSWRHQFTVISNYEGPGSEFNWDYEVTAFETLADLPGDIEAVKVEGLRADKGDAGEFTTAEWFAYGIGQVRSQRIQQDAENVVISRLSLVQMTLP